LKRNPALLAPENQAGLSRRALERGVADDSEEMEKAVLGGMIKDAEAIARARKEPAGGFQAAAQPSEPEPKPAPIEPAPKRSVPYAAPVTRGGACRAVAFGHSTQCKDLQGEEALELGEGGLGRGLGVFECLRIAMVD
jgi:hypothetical protein